MAPLVMAPDRIDSLVTTTEAAQLAGVALKTIHSWVRRGHLVEQGRDPKTNRPLFRFLDVAKAEHATRRRAKRHVA